MCDKTEAKFMILKFVLAPGVGIHRVVFCKDEEDVNLEKKLILDNPKVVNQGTYVVVPILDCFQI